MLGFFFKKNFYDGWDNVMYFFVPNLILDAILCACGGLAYLVTKIPDKAALAGILVWAVLLLVVYVSVSILALAWAEYAVEIADYGAPDFKSFFYKIPGCVKDGILYAVLMYALSIITVTGALYYLKPQSGEELPFVGLLAGSMFCWVALAVFMGLFWYPSMRALMHDPFKKCVKKCFVVLFDNLGKCFMIFFYNLILLFISVVMLGLAPGLAGIGLSRVNSLRLLIKKYDYIEELNKKNEPANSKARRKIPWNEILKEEIEATGTRGFKSFFMPWKELQEPGAGKKRVDPEEDPKWREE